MNPRHRAALGCASVLLLLSGCAAAAGGGGGADVSNRDPGEEIRAALQASADAWNRGDLEGHLAIYVDSVTFMTPDGPRPGVQGIEEAFRASYFRDGQPRQSLAFDSLEIRRLGTDSALVTGRFVLSGGGEPEQSGWYTLVWQRTADGWRAVHDHSS